MNLVKKTKRMEHNKMTNQINALQKSWDILNNRLEETTLQEDRNLIINQMIAIKLEILTAKEVK